MRMSLVLLMLMIARLAIGEVSVSKRIMQYTASGAEQIGTVPTIGQMGHVVVAQFRDNGGACTLAAPGGEGWIALLGSFDNWTTYVVIGWDGYSNRYNDDPEGSGPLIIHANGIYPYLAVRSQYTGANCRVDVRYSGSRQAVPYQPQLIRTSTSTIINAVSNVSIQTSSPYSRIHIMGIDAQYTAGAGTPVITLSRVGPPVVTSYNWTLSATRPYISIFEDYHTPLAVGWTANTMSIDISSAANTTTVTVLYREGQ